MALAWGRDIATQLWDCLQRGYGCCSAPPVEGSHLAVSRCQCWHGQYVAWQANSFQVGAREIHSGHKDSWLVVPGLHQHQCSATKKCQHPRATLQVSACKYPSPQGTSREVFSLSPNVQDKVVNKTL